MQLLNPPPDYSLDPQRIDIWAFFLNNDQNVDKYLSKEEKNKANRFLFSRHQRRYAVSHAILRILLSRYLETSPPSIQFIKGKHGKPFIEDSCHLEFNLTHSGELAILAVGQKFEMGIDVEFFSSRPYEGIAENLYSSKEINGFLKLPSYLRPLSFFNIWSQKEAFIKANGMGLSYPTKDFSVPILPSQNQTLVFDSMHQKEWKLLSFMPEIACNAALCCDPSIENIFYRLIDFFEYI